MMRRGLLLAGLATLAAAWLGPLPDLARGSFAAHMAMHMAVVAVSSGLLAAGLAGGRLDPARRWPGVCAPLPASLVELVVVWGWHAPALHHFARASATGLVLEQASFLASGLYLWSSALGGSREPGEGRAGAGVVGLLLTSMHMTLLGALLALAPRSLYPHHAGAGALADQQLGGAVMLLVGGASYLAGGLALAAGLLRQRAHLVGRPS